MEVVQDEVVKLYETAQSQQQLGLKIVIRNVVAELKHRQGVPGYVDVRAPGANPNLATRKRHRLWRRRDHGHLHAALREPTRNLVRVVGDAPPLRRPRRDEGDFHMYGTTKVCTMLRQLNCRANLAPAWPSAATSASLARCTTIVLRSEHEDVLVIGALRARNPAPRTDG